MPDTTPDDTEKPETTVLTVEVHSDDASRMMVAAIAALRDVHRAAVALEAAATVLRQLLYAGHPAGDEAIAKSLAAAADLAGHTLHLYREKGDAMQRRAAQ